MSPNKIMSEEKLHDFEKHLESLKWVVAVGWALLAGAFALGIWVATLEMRQSGVSARLTDHDAVIKSHSLELGNVAVRQAVNSNDLQYIKATVDRIEKKIAP